MLITTHAGIVVNTDHVAYLACRRHPDEPNAPADSAERERRFKLLFCLANGDAIVAAVQLQEEEARSLRQILAGRWAAGDRLVDVNTLLQRPAADASPRCEQADTEARTTAQEGDSSVSD